MKKLIFLLLIVPKIGLSQSNFYKGCSAGWKKGYCGESYGDLSHRLFQQLQAQERDSFLMKMVMQLSVLVPKSNT